MVAIFRTVRTIGTRLEICCMQLLIIGSTKARCQCQLQPCLNFRSLSAVLQIDSAGTVGCYLSTGSAQATGATIQEQETRLPSLQEPDYAQIEREQAFFTREGIK
jgi:hypothetical protein